MDVCRGRIVECSAKRLAAMYLRVVHYPQVMDAFWGNLIVTVIGTFLGAGGAVMAAFLLRIGESRRNEIAALAGLIAELNLRRALAPNSGIMDSAHNPRASTTVDMERASHSVIDIRTRISVVRGSLRTKSLAFSPLNDMTRSCNLYLELSSAAPARYASALEALRDSLDNHVGTIAQAFRIDASELRPGLGAFPTRGD